MTLQSRNKLLTPESDNYNFAKFVESDKVLDYLTPYFEKLEIKKGSKIVLFGEYCGRGIQKAVGVSSLSKRFVVFSATIFHKKEVGDDNNVDRQHLDKKHFETLNSDEALIYNIYMFPHYSIKIDFYNPKASIDELEKLTMDVEKECPVAKYFGVSGVGEGIVWSAKWNETHIKFKVKGEKHANTKTKKIVSHNKEQIESIEKFVDYSVTDNRMNQAIDEIFNKEGLEIEIKYMGSFLKWVVEDVFKEESDVMEDLPEKKVRKSISGKARMWFLQKLEEIVMSDIKN